MASDLQKAPIATRFDHLPNVIGSQASYARKALAKRCRFSSSRTAQARDRVTRGAGIFVNASEHELLTRKVVEIVFLKEVVLPPTTQWRRDALSEWHPAQTN